MENVWQEYGSVRDLNGYRMPVVSVKNTGNRYQDVPDVRCLDDKG